MVHTFHEKLLHSSPTDRFRIVDDVLDESTFWVGMVLSLDCSLVVDVSAETKKPPAVTAAMVADGRRIRMMYY